MTKIKYSDRKEPVFSKKEEYLLKLLFPGIKWNYVKFKPEMPWFMSKGNALAVVLPDNFSSTKLNVHFKNYSSDCQSNLCTLYHEAIHVQQYMDLKIKFKFGFGYFRNFMWHYLGWHIALVFKAFYQKKIKWHNIHDYAYKNNPLEVEAYAKEADFREVMTFNREDPLPILIQLNPSIIISKSSYIGAPPLWAFSIACFFTLIISMLKPFLDIFAAVISFSFRSK